MLASLGLIALVAAAEPTPSVQDRANIALSTAIVQRLGDRLWPNWSQTPFRIDLLTQDGPVLVNIEKPFTPPKFPRDLEATLFLDGRPTIVIGQPKYTQANTPVRWSVTLLHEHFHQWQQYWPQYETSVKALDLARGDKTAMWMLNYAFPYGDPSVDEAYARMANALADALDAMGKPEFNTAVQTYLQARGAFKTLLSPDDYRYFAFQCWQEGTARYTEIAAARLAASTHASDPSFLTGAQATALGADADQTYAAVVKRLRTISLQQDKRVDLYALGAGEALLLDRISPDWHQRYLDPRMDLSAYFPADKHLTILAPGLYRGASGEPLYVGVEHELPDPPVNEYYDPQTARYGDVPDSRTLTLERPVLEERRIVQTPHGPLGVSLYHADSRRRATVILIHGSDPETREVGFLIPFFVVNGLNVISYDQRGTGESSGNWRLNGPVQRAADVDAVFDAFQSNALIDSSRTGVWGFSNGGWTAPIVATQRPIAFMLLKSAPGESIEQNLYYEVKQTMMRHRYTPTETAQALSTWNVLLGALAGTASWQRAERSYESAEKQRWFGNSLLPSGLPMPIPAALADGFRRFIFYDPANTLVKVRTPTLALFGVLDHSVDEPHASRTLRADFSAAGMRDFTMRTYPNAGHLLVVSRDGFAPAMPERLAGNYPVVMLEWLKKRLFVR